MQHRSKKIKKSFFIILVVLIVLSGSSAIYLGNYYHSVDVEKYMTSSSEVTIKKFDKGWFFDGAGEESLDFLSGSKGCDRGICTAYVSACRKWNRLFSGRHAISYGVFRDESCGGDHAGIQL